MSLPETTPRSRVWTRGRFSMGIFSTPNCYDATRPRPTADHDYVSITFAKGALPTRSAVCGICQQDIQADDDTIMHQYTPSRFDPPAFYLNDLETGKCCGNACHQDCFKNWCAATQKGQYAIICPYCRGEMPWRAVWSHSYLRGEFPWGEKINLDRQTHDSSEASELASPSGTTSSTMPPTTHQAETPSVSAPVSGRSEIYTAGPTPYYPPPPMSYPANDSSRQSADSTRTSEATPSSPLDEGVYSPSADPDSVFYDGGDTDDEAAGDIINRPFLGRPPARVQARRRDDNFTTDFTLDETSLRTPRRQQRPESSPIFLSLRVVFRNDHVEIMSFDTTGMTPEQIRANMAIARHSRSGSYTISQPGNETDTLSYSDHLRMLELCNWANWALIRQRKLIFGQGQGVVRGDDGALRVQQRRQREYQEMPENEHEEGDNVEDGEDTDDEREDDAECGVGGHQEANGDEDDMDEPLGGQGREAMEMIRYHQSSIEDIDRRRASLQETIQAPGEVAREGRPREAMEITRNDQRFLERHDRLVARAQGLLQPLDEEARVLRARESEERFVIDTRRRRFAEG